jgi:hypothetical protein
VGSATAAQVATATMVFAAHHASQHIGKSVVDVVIIVCGQRDLLEIVAALRASRRFARRLHGREQQRDQHRDNRDHDQQFNEREPFPPNSHLRPFPEWKNEILFGRGEQAFAQQAPRSNNEMHQPSPTGTAPSLADSESFSIKKRAFLARLQGKSAWLSTLVQWGSQSHVS